MAVVARILPSGEKAADRMKPEWPVMAARARRAARSQIRTTRSAPPEARMLPSGEKART
jgi:hypothetical protein